MDVSPMNQMQEEKIIQTLGIDDTTQSKIGVDKKRHLMEEDVVDVMMRKKSC